MPLILAAILGQFGSNLWHVTNGAWEHGRRPANPRTGGLRWCEYVSSQTP